MEDSVAEDSAAETAATLIDCGLRAHHLRAAGYSTEAVVAQTCATAQQLEQLGF